MHVFKINSIAVKHKILNHNILCITLHTLGFLTTSKRITSHFYKKLKKK